MSTTIHGDMRLSRRVPARTKTLRARWVRMDFQTFGFYRSVRERSRMYVQDACHWCRGKFLEEEMMALAEFEKGNKLLCQDCAAKLAETAEQQGETT